MYTLIILVLLIAHLEGWQSLADCSGLENRSRRNPLAGGSNPSLSACFLRDMGQFGSLLDSDSRRRRFKSCYPDVALSVRYDKVVILALVAFGQGRRVAHRLRTGR